MKIRKAKIRDCIACEGLSTRCKELANVSGQSNYFGWFVEFIRNKQVFLVAEERGKIIGFVAGEINTGYALMQLLAVDDRHRGRGIGRELIKRFEGICFRRKTIHILLYGYKDRKDFFEGQGYKMGSPCFEFMKVLGDRRKTYA